MVRCFATTLTVVILTLTSLVVVVAVPTNASSKSIIQCKADSSPPITITLGAKRALGNVLNCVDSDLFTDLTPCAPDGKFGLSAPTGSAAIVEIVARPQDYMSHTGGVTGNWISDSQIYFNIGFVSYGSFDEQWRFLVNRLDGTATLSDGDGKVQADYLCSKAKAKF